VEHSAQARLAELYLLAAIDVPFVSDPVRSSEAERVALYQLFQETLESFGARVVRIDGSWDERYSQAVGAVEGLRG
jgi:nicotinamide riboside kinase